MPAAFINISKADFEPWNVILSLFPSIGGTLIGVLMIRAFLLRVYIRAPDFRQLPFGSCGNHVL